MVGTGIVAGIGQLVVNMPAGYFGASDHLTTVGIFYAAFMLAATTACGIATVAGSRLARWAFVAVTTLGVAFFLPALSSDITVGSVIVVWQTAALARELAHRSSLEPWRPNEPTLAYRPAVVHILMVSLLVTILVVGFQLTSLIVGQVACIVLAAATLGTTLIVLRSLQSIRNWVLAGTLIGAGVLALAPGLLTLIATLGVIQVGLLVIAVFHGPLFSELLQHFLRRSGLQVLLTFASVALGGAILLTFPAASEGTPVAPLDALFTAVSATCVTGLIVLDTPHAFSAFGEAVILLLIQVGGLGIMVLSSFATLFLGQRLTLRGEHALEQSLDIEAPGRAYRLVRFIVLSTLAIEVSGGAVLSSSYYYQGWPLGEAIWRGMFHAVSAFCNAGFALQTDSLVMFQSDPLALAVHAVLIVIGGLGFGVVAWVSRRMFRRQRERAPVQVKVVLWLSCGFILIGTILYAALEWNASLGALDAEDKLVNALFQSVTMRTAGFNSVDLSLLRPATILLTIVFMFVGAAPGGTGGGIKITTFAVLTAALTSVAGKSRRPVMFGRGIPESILLRAATIAAMSLSIGALALFLLLLTEDAGFVPLWFEVISALGTVGLSLGVTGGLSGAGKSIIIATMFIGRVGPLTVALAAGGGKRPLLDYPDTSIMVG